MRLFVEIPNPALKPWSVLVGEWKTVEAHRLRPNTPVHGLTTFEWLQGGAFLMMRAEIEEEGFPSAISIIGSDDATNEYFMLYYDDRGVSRKYEATLRENTWTLLRIAPGFSQRFAGRFMDDGDTIIGIWELSEDDSTWKRDLELKYSRVK